MKKTGDSTEIVIRNEVPVITYHALNRLDGIIHGFSTRQGGVSRDHLGTMNLSFSRGDSEEHVRENFRRMAAALGVKEEQMVFSVQTHTTNVRRTGKWDHGKGLTRPCDYTDVDGLITDEPGTCLVTFYADCVPLFFVDPVRRAIGLSHSGWKGTVGKIGKQTIEQMTRAYGTRPEDVIAAIGPSICMDCYEVSADVAEQFQQAFDPKLHERLMYEKADGKYQLNLWEANRQVLLEAGLDEAHISMPDICTCCNSEEMFSHRASKGQRGNLAAFLCLKE